jgi:hypothetical protein
MAEKEQGGSQGESNDKGRRYFFNDVEKGNEPKLMVEFLAIEAEKKQGNKNQDNQAIVLQIGTQGKALETEIKSQGKRYRHQKKVKNNNQSPHNG